MQSESQNQPIRPPRYNRPHRGGYCAGRHDQPAGPDLPGQKSRKNQSECQNRERGPLAGHVSVGKAGADVASKSRSKGKEPPESKQPRQGQQARHEPTVGARWKVASAPRPSPNEWQPSIIVWDQPTSRHDHRTRPVSSPAEQQNDAPDSPRPSSCTHHYMRRKSVQLILTTRSLPQLGSSRNPHARRSTLFTAKSLRRLCY